MVLEQITCISSYGGSLKSNKINCSTNLGSEEWKGGRRYGEQEEEREGELGLLCKIKTIVLILKVCIKRQVIFLIYFLMD